MSTHSSFHITAVMSPGKRSSIESANKTTMSTSQQATSLITPKYRLGKEKRTESNVGGDELQREQDAGRDPGAGPVRDVRDVGEGDEARVEVHAPAQKLGGVGRDGGAAEEGEHAADPAGVFDA